MSSAAETIIDKINKSPPKSKPMEKLDAVELTLILKAAGFHLESFDFQLPREQRTVDEDVRVDIRCHKSGIVSKLRYKATECTCPNENESQHNTSFWEVQGTSPGLATNSKAFIDTSSSLLPDLPQSIINLSTKLLQIILLAIKENEEVAAQILKQFTTSLTSNAIQQDTKDILNGNATGAVMIAGGAASLNNDAHSVTPTAPLGSTSASFTTPLSSINVTPMNASDFVDSAVGAPVILFNGIATQNSIPLSPSINTCRNGTEKSSDIFMTPDLVTSSPRPKYNINSDLNPPTKKQIILYLQNARLLVDQSLSALNGDDLTDTSIVPSLNGSKQQLNKYTMQKRRNSMPSNNAVGKVGSSATVINRPTGTKKDASTPLIRTVTMSKKFPTTMSTIPKKITSTKSTLVANVLSKVNSNLTGNKLNFRASTGSTVKKPSPYSGSAASAGGASTSSSNSSLAKSSLSTVASSSSSLTKAKSLTKIPGTKN